MKKHFKKYIILFLLIISIIILSFINIFASNNYFIYIDDRSNDTVYLNFYSIKSLKINNQLFNFNDYTNIQIYYSKGSNTSIGATYFINFNYRLNNTWTRFSYYDVLNDDIVYIELLDYLNSDTEFKLYYRNNSINTNINSLQDGIPFNINYTDNLYIELDRSTSNDIKAKVNISFYYDKSQPLTKTYNYPTLFYNNGYIFDSIEINGQSSDTTKFDSIDNIKYINTSNNTSYTVYNGYWLNNFTSTLYWSTIVPDLSSINSDCNNIVTFTTQQIYQLTNTYNTGQFINNGNTYDSISVSGLSLNNSTFMSISNIQYNSDTVYENGSFLNGYSSTLYYNFDVPNITQLNIDCNSLITFNTYYINPSPEQKFFHDLIQSTQGILDIVTSFANVLLSKIVFVVMCIAIPLVTFAVTKIIQLLKIRKGS